MRDLDQMLINLRLEPVHPGLSDLDSAVVAGIAVRREAVVARRGMILAGLVAVTIGGLASLTPTAPAFAEPLLSVPDAAPSQLLGR